MSDRSSTSVVAPPACETKRSRPRTLPCGVPMLPCQRRASRRRGPRRWAGGARPSRASEPRPAVAPTTVRRGPEPAVRAECRRGAVGRASSAARRAAPDVEPVEPSVGGACRQHEQHPPLGVEDPRRRRGIADLDPRDRDLSRDGLRPLRGLDDVRRDTDSTRHRRLPARCRRAYGPSGSASPAPPGPACRPS